MRQTTVFAVLLATVMSVALFYLKYEVTALEDEFEILNREIKAEREAVHVLRAEWSHLNDSDRIKLLAEKYLELSQTVPRQIKEVRGIPQIQIVDDPDQEVVFRP